MIVGFEQQAAHVAHKFGKSRIADEAAAEGKWARAEADEPGLGATLATRDRNADNDICLPRQTVDHREVSGQQRHEECAALSPPKTL